MNTKTLLLICTIAGQSALTVEAQGTFQNLNFESASPVPTPGDFFQYVEFSTAFPGWVGFIGGVQQSTALYNRSYLDSSGIGIIDRDWPHWLGPTGGVIFGNFTALLQAGVTGVNNTPADTTLSQTSLVPVNAESLRFRAYSFPYFGPLHVILGGQRLPLVTLASGTNYTQYGADIHAWQGQVAQLDFTVFASRLFAGNNSVFLDFIQFSTQPIPEPGVLGLIGLGALFFGWRCLSKSRS